jgi:hypothetical protein
MAARAPQPSDHAPDQSRKVAAAGLASMDVERDSRLVDKMPEKDYLARAGRLRSDGRDDKDVNTLHY